MPRAICPKKYDPLIRRAIAGEGWDTLCPALDYLAMNRYSMMRRMSEVWVPRGESGVSSALWRLQSTQVRALLIEIGYSLKNASVEDKVRAALKANIAHIEIAAEFGVDKSIVSGLWTRPSAKAKSDKQTAQKLVDIGDDIDPWPKDLWYESLKFKPAPGRLSLSAACERLAGSSLGDCEGAIASAHRRRPHQYVRRHGREETFG